MGFFDSFAYGYTAIVPRINFKKCSIIQYGENVETDENESGIRLNEENFVKSFETSINDN